MPWCCNISCSANRSGEFPKNESPLSLFVTPTSFSWKSSEVMFAALVEVRRGGQLVRSSVGFELKVPDHGAYSACNQEHVVMVERTAEAEWKASVFMAPAAFEGTILRPVAVRAREGYEPGATCRDGT